MRTVVRDLVLLLAMCLVLYCTGLDAHGVTNWQEAQRVVVSREMQERAAAGERGAWTVPRHHGLAYVAKPPMIYWVTVGLAEVRGGRVELFDLRLAVALAGTLGVLGTYLVARGVLRPVSVKWGEPPDERHIVGARWAAVFLATGVLYFRSARIGELDIIMVPFVVGAIGCIWIAWRRFLERRGGDAEMTIAGSLGLRAHWPAVGGAAVCAVLATLTKGPPSLMVIAFAGYGGFLMWECLKEDRALARPEWRMGALVGGAFAVLAAWHVRGVPDVAGVVITGLIGAALGAGIVRLSSRGSLRSIWLALAHTHPVLVLGAALLAFWWWGQELSRHIGSEQVILLAKEQAENDINLFQPASPMRNLEGLAYGCGVGSVVMLLAAGWWVRYRPRARASAAGMLMPVAWVLLSYAALSLVGKGVVRYLTPVWPGVAVIAGAWLTRRRAPGERGEARPRSRALLGAVCALLGAGQAWWYAQGREIFEHERSPRALMGELARTEDQGRFASFEFYTPALDYYAGAYVQPIVNAQMGVSIAGGPAWTIEDLAKDVRAHGAMLVLCRGRSLDPSLPPPEERMRAAGLRVEPLETRAVFEIDNGRAAVRVFRVR
jgi:4-amino-4-deoxy-L-arabinose transferase-like glycosyltransferase